MSKKLLILFATIITLVSNIAANLLPYNNQSTAQVSDKFITLFTPAGYVFVIWGVIYVGLIAFTAYFLLQPKENEKEIEQITPWYLVTSMANSTWLVAWHYENLPVSVALMIALLISLISLYQLLDIGRKPVPAKEKYLVHTPISIYLGWISVATIANIASFLTSIDWNGFGLPDVFWVVGLGLVVTILSIYLLFKRGDLAYTCVIIWAFSGIWIKHNAVDTIRIIFDIYIFVLLFAIAKLLLGRRKHPVNVNT